MGLFGKVQPEKKLFKVIKDGAANQLKDFIVQYQDEMDRYLVHRDEKRKNMTPLQYAIKLQKVAVIQILLKAYINEELKNLWHPQYGNLLHFAEQANDLMLVKYLIELGVEPFQEDSRGYTPLDRIVERPPNDAIGKQMDQLIRRRVLCSGNLKFKSKGLIKQNFVDYYCILYYRQFFDDWYALDPSKPRTPILTMWLIPINQENLTETGRPSDHLLLNGANIYQEAKSIGKFDKMVPETVMNLELVQLHPYRFRKLKNMAKSNDARPTVQFKVSKAQFEFAQQMKYEIDHNPALHPSETQLPKGRSGSRYHITLKAVQDQEPIVAEGPGQDDEKPRGRLDNEVMQKVGSEKNAPSQKSAKSVGTAVTKTESMDDTIDDEDRQTSDRNLDRYSQNDSEYLTDQGNDSEIEEEYNQSSSEKMKYNRDISQGSNSYRNHSKKGSFSSLPNSSTSKREPPPVQGTREMYQPQQNMSKKAMQQQQEYDNAVWKFQSQRNNVRRNDSRPNSQLSSRGQSRQSNYDKEDSRPQTPDGGMQQQDSEIQQVGTPGASSSGRSYERAATSNNIRNVRNVEQKKQLNSKGSRSSKDKYDQISPFEKMVDIEVAKEIMKLEDQGETLDKDQIRQMIKDQTKKLQQRYKTKQDGGSIQERIQQQENMQQEEGNGHNGDEMEISFSFGARPNVGSSGESLKMRHQHNSKPQKLPLGMEIEEDVPQERKSPGTFNDSKSRHRAHSTNGIIQERTNFDQPNDLRDEAEIRPNRQYSNNRNSKNSINKQRNNSEGYNNAFNSRQQTSDGSEYITDPAPSAPEGPLDENVVLKYKDDYIIEEDEEQPTYKQQNIESPNIQPEPYQQKQRQYQPQPSYKRTSSKQSLQERKNSFPEPPIYDEPTYGGPDYSRTPSIQIEMEEPDQFMPRKSPSQQDPDSRQYAKQQSQRGISPSSRNYQKSGSENGGAVFNQPQYTNSDQGQNQKAQRRIVFNYSDVEVSHGNDRKNSTRSEGGAQLNDRKNSTKSEGDSLQKHQKKSDKRYDVEKTQHRSHSQGMTDSVEEFQIVPRDKTQNVRRQKSPKEIDPELRSPKVGPRQNQSALPPTTPSRRNPQSNQKPPQRADYSSDDSLEYQDGSRKKDGSVNYLQRFQSGKADQKPEPVSASGQDQSYKRFTSVGGNAPSRDRGLQSPSLSSKGQQKQVRMQEGVGGDSKFKRYNLNEPSTAHQNMKRKSSFNTGLLRTQEDVAEAKEQGLCVVCMDNSIQVGILHGKQVHYCLCEDCAKTHFDPENVEDATCPMCRQPCQNLVSVFTA